MIIEPDLKVEEEYWATDVLPCGVDEVGRGCIAGPVVAAAVILPKGHKRIKNVRDSKMMSPKMRERVCEELLLNIQDFGIGLVSAAEIDEIGIERATKKAMVEALAQLTNGHDMVLIDGNKELDLDIRQKAVVDGDATIYSISCASIIAKVFRDAILIGMHNAHPEYGFNGHKGYGAAKHYEAIKQHGIISEHRKTFLKNLF